jgi:hypothetical protein
MLGGEVAGWGDGLLCANKVPARRKQKGRTNLGFIDESLVATCR